MFNGGDAAKAEVQLGWTAANKLPDVVRLMAAAEASAYDETNASSRGVAPSHDR
jgi:hypothetical protein